MLYYANNMPIWRIKMQNENIFLNKKNLWKLRAFNATKVKMNKFDDTNERRKNKTNIGT